MTEAIAEALRQQYRAALAMLSDCIERCPEEAWDRSSDTNRFWHLSCHTLFFTSFYLSSNDEPVLWPKFRPKHQVLSAGPWAPDFDRESLIPYSREEMRECLQWTLERVEQAFLDASTELPSLFPWIPFSRFELYLYNLRHLQNHTGQLSERIRQLTDEGVAWVGKK